MSSMDDALGVESPHNKIKKKEVEVLDHGKKKMAKLLFNSNKDLLKALRKGTIGIGFESYKIKININKFVPKSVTET